jgi:hypothetical protein
MRMKWVFATLFFALAMTAVMFGAAALDIGPISLVAFYLMLLGMCALPVVMWLPEILIGFGY